MRIGFASSDWSFSYVNPDGGHSMGGAGWYRCGLPAQALAAHGHDVVVGRLVADRRLDVLGVQTWDEESHFDLDVLVMQRWMHADLPERVQRARACGQVIVNDVDDHYDGLDPANRAFQATHPKEHPAVNRDHYRKVLAASTAITVSTPFLYDRYSKLGHHVVLLRNAIDLARWDYQEPSDSWKPVFGWPGALGWRSGDVETLKGILGPLADRLDLRVAHVGHREDLGDFATAAGVDPERLDRHPMLPIEEWPRAYDHFDVCLIPLTDKPFNHAKSAIKGMEAAAAGRPFIAASTPEYEWFHNTHHVGAVARRPRMWIKAIERLCDPDVRSAEAKSARERVAELDIERQWEQWSITYESLASL